MVIKKNDDIKSSEITDQKVYLNRRFFMRGAVLAGTVTATGLVYRKLNPPPAELPKGEKLDQVARLAPDDAVRNGTK